MFYIWNMLNTVRIILFAVVSNSITVYGETADKQLVGSDISCPLGVTSCSVAAANVDTCCVPKYGLLVLVQQWHVDLGPPDQFTLHGLWPDTCTGKQTSSGGCDNSRIYANVSDIIQSASKGVNDTESLLEELNVFWPSYTGDNNVFWSHEWSKHGTCMTTLFPRCYGPSYTRYRDVIDYFQVVLELRKRYNLYSALSSAGIEPGADTEYSVVDSKSAIRDALGIDVVLKCKGGVLNEIWSWFHVKDATNYVPVEADTNSSSDTCVSTFIYPTKNTT